eukprot:SAG11_NODE_635_length_8040_cov_3.233472_8_plen_191_part_00
MWNIRGVRAMVRAVVGATAVTGTAAVLWRAPSSSVAAQTAAGGMDGSATRVIAPREADALRFHATMDRLRSISNMREAVAAGRRTMRTEATAGVYWDHANKRAEPGRVWHEAAQMPAAVRAELCRPLNAVEVRACRDCTGIDRIRPVPHGSAPQLLVVIGPAAAGKSKLLPRAAAHLGLPAAAAAAAAPL